MPGNSPGIGVRCLSAALTYLLLFQSGAQPLAALAQSAPMLKIVILEGEGAINNVRQRTAREPIVQVQDVNNRAVAGAVVLFTLPDRGAGGIFPNGSTSLTVTTDAQGRAIATGLRTNNIAGRFQIRVDASYQGQRANATITQSNAMTTAAAGGGASGKLIAILAIAGGAAAGGAIAATRGGKAAPPAPTPTSVSAGTPTVGPPR